VLLFSQHNEHRIVLDRLVFLGNYYLSGEVNFLYCIAVGNAGWLLTAITLIYYGRRRYGLSSIALLPIPYLLLAFTHQKNMFHAMAALSNYWLILFSLVFIICLVEEKTAACCILFPVALFTSGGGLVLYPLGNLFLISRKRWKPLAWFAIISSLSLACYFIGYHHPPEHPALSEALVLPGRTLHYCIVFLGNIGPLPGMPLPAGIVALAAGAVLCFIASWILYKRPADPFFELVFTFVAFSALTSALSRSGFGVHHALQSRYSMYPLFAAACCIVGAGEIAVFQQPAKWLTVVVTLLSMLYWGGMSLDERVQKDLLHQRTRRLAGIKAFETYHLGGLYYPDQYRAEEILISSSQAHIYRYRNVAR